MKPRTRPRRPKLDANCPKLTDEQEAEVQARIRKHSRRVLGDLRRLGQLGPGQMEEDPGDPSRDRPTSGRDEDHPQLSARSDDRRGAPHGLRGIGGLCVDHDRSGLLVSARERERERERPAPEARPGPAQGECTQGSSQAAAAVAEPATQEGSELVSQTNRIALLKERHERMKAQRNGNGQETSNGVGGGKPLNRLELAEAQRVLVKELGPDAEFADVHAAAKARGFAISQPQFGKRRMEQGFAGRRGRRPSKPAPADGGPPRHAAKAASEDTGQIYRDAFVEFALATAKLGGVNEAERALGALRELQFA